MFRIIKQQKSKRFFIIFPAISFALITMWYITTPVTTEAEKSNPSDIKQEITVTPYIYGERYVVINLNKNTVELHDSKNIEEIAIVSQGKPGSYYETIGGAYTESYKEALHFSSIGHVYMPYSIHVFGNYFIHGIPYYEDGTKVSSTYSGGCIRLADNDAARVYAFIQRNTPIIITRNTSNDFIPTKKSESIINSDEMTRLMVATISLELLKQDIEILDVDGLSYTTRKNKLPSLLIDHDLRVSTLYAESIGTHAFVKAMNEKAEALGMSNTIFFNVTDPTSTTEEDYVRFMNYIATYKSYIKQVAVSR